MGFYKELISERRPVHAPDGELLLSTRDICDQFDWGYTGDRARQIIRRANLEPYTVFGNVMLYRKSQIVQAIIEDAPVAAGLVPQAYITRGAKIHNTTLRRYLPQLPTPRVSKVTKDGRVFRYWKKADADRAIEKLLRIHK